MGWRAIRVGLDRPAVLRRQLRALLRAAAGRTLRVMFPLVATAAEFDRARALLERERDRARTRGDPCADAVIAGSMVEVPSLLWQLPALLARVDFLSLGTNDLLQFPLRRRPRRAGDGAPLRPAVAAGAGAGSASWRRPAARRGLRFRSAANRPGARWRRWRWSDWACANCRCRRARVGPVKAMCRSLDTRPARRAARLAPRFPRRRPPPPPPRLRTRPRGRNLTRRAKRARARNPNDSCATDRASKVKCAALPVTLSG